MDAINKNLFINHIMNLKFREKKEKELQREEEEEEERERESCLLIETMKESPIDYTIKSKEKTIYSFLIRKPQRYIFRAKRP